MRVKNLLISFVIFLLSACGGDNTSPDIIDGSGLVCIDNDSMSCESDGGVGEIDFPEIIEGNELVYIKSGSIQCVSEGMSVDETAQLLLDEGVEVVFSYCGYLSGVSVPTQCGVDGLNIHLHEINRQDLIDAELIGFISVSSMEANPDLDYILSECPEYM